MTQITVSEGQTLQDIAIQYLGDASRSNEIAELNNISLTTDLLIGQILNIPDVDISMSQMVKGFSDNKIVPASNDFHDFEDDQEGIGFWTIENDFIVS